MPRLYQPCPGCAGPSGCGSGTGLRGPETGLPVDPEWRDLLLHDGAEKFSVRYAREPARYDHGVL